MQFSAALVLVNKQNVVGGILVIRTTTMIYINYREFLTFCTKYKLAFWIMRYITTLILLIGLQMNTFSQITPSIYAGLGRGTNLGGTLGIGTELRYKMVSLNCAIGSWIDEFPSHTGAQSRFDYDLGLKIYSKYGLFLGTNYGIIGEALYTKEGQDIMHFEKTHGFSFTLGYRRNIYKNVFGMVYIGLTSNKNENTFTLFDDKTFFPRLGVIVGYDFKKID